MFEFSGMKQRCLDAENLKNSLDTSSNSNSATPQNETTSNNVVTDFRKRKCSDFQHLGYECVPHWKCVNGKFKASAR